jgi:predicted dienelactone hydrolase
VITEVLKVDGLAAHIDAARIGAAGHSAGGFTTAGMLMGTRDSRLRAAVIVAGGTLGGSFTGTRLPVLFVHGEKDNVVVFQGARNLYGALPWPKAFLTLVGGGHSEYLFGSGSATNATSKTIVDFLRYGLYGDSAARGRLAGGGTVSGVAKFESALG